MRFGLRKNIEYQKLSTFLSVIFFLLRAASKTFCLEELPFRIFDRFF
jgi:hypothetical protein